MHVQSCCFLVFFAVLVAVVVVVVALTPFCFGGWQPPLWLCSHYTRYLFVPMWKAIRGILFSNLRLRGRPGRDGCQTALWDCFGGRIFNIAANSSPKTVPQCTISTRSPAQPQSGERMAMAQNWNELFTHIEHRKGVVARRVWCTNPSPHFWIFTFASFRLPSSLLLIYFRYSPELTPLRC